MKNSSSKLVQSLLHRGLYGSVAAAATVAAFGMISSEALAGISSTKHNLTSTSGQTNKSSGTEICAFCHTPHGSNTAVSAAPLWNKKVPDASTFTVYSTTTLESPAGTNTPGANSLICLSCHDGVQSMDSMINKPGSGGWDTTGPSAGYTWSGNVSATGVMGAGITNIGTNLQNDHPIGVQYCGGGMTNPSTIGTCADTAFNTPTVTSGKWRVGSLVLYADAGNRVNVECGSCHDPHLETNGTFLRISNAASAVCLTCHNK